MSLSFCSSSPLRPTLTLPLRPPVLVNGCSPKEKLSPCSPSLLSIVLLKNEIPCVYIQPHRADRSSESSRLVDDLRALHWWPVASGAPITNNLPCLSE